MNDPFHENAVRGRRFRRKEREETVPVLEMDINFTLRGSLNFLLRGKSYLHKFKTLTGK